MKNYLEEAINEFKRAEHLLHVTLKYTRTVDVLKILINRLVQTIDFLLEGILNKLKDEKKIDVVPSQPGVRCNVLLEHFPEDKKLINYINFYLLLRKLLRIKYTKINEFRRHVALVYELDGKEDKFNIDKSYEYFEETNKFINYYKIILGIKINDEDD